MNSEITSNMLEHIRKICEYDRIPGSAEYNQAIQYIQSQVVDCGIQEIIEFPASNQFWGWRLPESINHWHDENTEKRAIEFDVGGNIRLLDVLVPGKSVKELLLITHLDHPRPSANDNASGPAMMIELIKYLSINKPALSIRFLFTIEYWGTVAYFSRFTAKKDNIVAGISLDMVGGCQEKARSTLIVDEIPHHQISSLDLLLYKNLEKYTHDGKYRSVGLPVKSIRSQKIFFTGGSDHYILNDSSIGIPSTCINTYPDIYYHTKNDTPDKISDKTLNVFFKTIIETLPEFADAINGKNNLSICLAANSTYQLLLSYFSRKIQINEGAKQEKDSFIVAHMIDMFYQKSGAKKNKSTEELFLSLNHVYQNLFDNKIYQINFGTQEKYIKNYVGPLYRMELFSKLTLAEKNKLNDLHLLDKLFFAKSELCINYFTLGYDEFQSCWLIDFHYESSNFIDLFQPYLDMLLEKGFLTKKD